MKKLIPMIMILVFAGVIGCSKFGGEAKDKTKLGSEVVAQVGDEKIMAGDIEEILSHIPPQYRVRYGSQQGRREIVNGLVDIKMLSYEARERGLDKKDSVRMKLSYLTDQTLAKELEGELKKSYQVTDADIQKYYDEHKEKYTMPERIKASHILVEDQAQAESILKQVRKGGNFEALAKQYSKDSSGQRGGDLGWFGKGRMDPGFEKAAFALKKGEVSGVVKSAFGYHIIRLEDRREGSSRPFDQVKKPIERAIQRERMEKELNAMKESIKKKASVSVNEDYFKKFEGQAQPAIPELGAPVQGPAAPMKMGPMAAPAAPAAGPAPAPAGK